MATSPMKKPPFRLGHSVALAYVRGKYWEPSSETPKTPGYLVLYFSNRDPCLKFITLTRGGKVLASSVVTTHAADVGYALIYGWLKYMVPFDQWHTYPLGAAENAVVKRLRVSRPYSDAERSLCAVLWQARDILYFGEDPEDAPPVVRVPVKVQPVDQGRCRRAGTCPERRLVAAQDAPAASKSVSTAQDSERELSTTTLPIVIPDAK